MWRQLLGEKEEYCSLLLGTLYPSFTSSSLSSTLLTIHMKNRRYDDKPLTRSMQSGCQVNNWIYKINRIRKIYVKKLSWECPTQRYKLSWTDNQTHKMFEN